MEQFGSSRNTQNSLFDQQKASQFAAFLKILNEANEYSKDLSISPWNFAIPFSDTKKFHVNKNDLRWMIAKGWIKSDDPETDKLTNDPAIDFPRKVSDTSQFILGELKPATIKFLLPLSVPALPLSPEATAARKPQNTDNFDTPKWNTERRELYFHGEMVKRFRWPAPNQETILEVFSEEGWPLKIEDPLPQESGLNPKRRLGDTIKCLNRNQRASLIRFRGDGTGEGVIWERNSFHS